MQNSTTKLDNEYSVPTDLYDYVLFVVEEKIPTLSSSKSYTVRSIFGEDKWNDLREKLQMDEWPRVYMYKFIVPANNERIAQVEKLFNTQEAQVTMRTSKKGNFVSITAKEMMMSPDSVIERYKKAEGIEGLISL